MDWGDAWGSSGWYSPEQANSSHKALEVKSTGFVIKADKVGISLSQGFDSNGNPVGQHFIPRKMIKKITKVKY